MLAVVAEQRTNSMGPIPWHRNLHSQVAFCESSTGAGLRSSDRPPPALWQYRRGTSPISSASVLGDYVRSPAPVYLTSGVLPFVPLARFGPTTPKHSWELSSIDRHRRIAARRCAQCTDRHSRIDWQLHMTPQLRPDRTCGYECHEMLMHNIVLSEAAFDSVFEGSWLILLNKAPCRDRSGTIWDTSTSASKPSTESTHAPPRTARLRNARSRGGLWLPRA
jgi:hypothetical protein